MNRDSRNHIGSQILNWCKARNMQYSYACATKKQRSLETQVKAAQRQMNDILAKPPQIVNRQQLEYGLLPVNGLLGKSSLTSSLFGRW